MDDEWACAFTGPRVSECFHREWRWLLTFRGSFDIYTPCLQHVYDSICPKYPLVACADSYPLCFGHVLSIRLCYLCMRYYKYIVGRKVTGERFSTGIDPCQPLRGTKIGDLQHSAVGVHQHVITLRTVNKNTR